MLLKLLKHEFRSTGRVILPVIAAVAGLSIMSGIAMRLLAANISLHWTIRVLLGVVQFAFGASLFAACIVAFVMMIQRFYKSLMGDEGYISFTLPVTVDGHIWSKLITSAVWFAAVAVICAAASALAFSIGGSSIDFSIAGFFETANSEFGVGNVIGFVLEAVLMAVLACFAACQHFYAAMAMGCSASNNKKLLSVVWYFALAIGRNILALAAVPMIVRESVFSWLDLHFSFDTLMEAIPGFHFIAGACCAALFILGAAYYIITRMFLKKKLNLA